MFQTLPYNRGATAVAAENPHLGAHESFLADRDPTNTLQLRSNSFVRAMWVQNKSGSSTAILGCRVCKWASGFYKAGVLITGAGDIACGASDDFLPAAGVPDTNWFWLIREGSVTLVSDGGTTLAQTDTVVTSTSGKVKKQTAAPADTTAAMVQVNSKVGNPQAAVTNVDGTKFVAEIGFP